MFYSRIQAHKQSIGARQWLLDTRYQIIISVDMERLTDYPFSAGYCLTIDMYVSLSIAIRLSF